MDEPEVAAKMKGAWFREMIDKETVNDKIGGGALFGEIAALVAISAIFAFFIAHELRDTGFYTDEFGALEKFLLFGAGGFAVSLIALRIVIRRKNVIRPLDFASMIMFVVAHVVLLAVFPFDFTYVGDALPGYLSWTVSWISDDLGAVLLALGAGGGTIGAAFIGVIYVHVKKRLEESPTTQ
ncbi:MAG: hypothetical protein WBD03_00520 [Thermoplasmata archaeon]